MISRFLAGIVFLVGVVASMADAAILHGPVINPANGRAYYLLEADTWQGSAAQANQLGGHLVVINDQAENDWVVATFGRFGGVGRNLWLGLSDAAREGTFEWMSRDVVSFARWKAGEPDNSQAEKNYVYLAAALGESEGPGGEWAISVNAGDGGPVPFHGVVEADSLENDSAADWLPAYYRTPWSFGWRAGADGEFKSFVSPPFSGYGLRVFSDGSHATPNARVNFNQVPAGNPTLQPYELVLEPGSNGEYVECIWTAPMSGTFVFDVTFLDIDPTGDGQDVHVLVDGTEVFSAMINAADGSGRATYSSPVPIPLVQGRAVIVRIGTGGTPNAQGDSTRVDAVLRYPGTKTAYYFQDQYSTRGISRVTGVRTDNAGNTVVSFQSNDSQRKELLYDAAGNLLGVGSGKEPFTDSEGNYVRFENVKISKYKGADESLLWERVYEGRSLAGMRLDKQGNVVVAGVVADSSGTSGASDFYLAKYASKDGTVLWEKRVDGLGKDVSSPRSRWDSIRQITLDAEGNVLIVGSYEDVGAYPPYDYGTSTSFCVEKHAAEDGRLLWRNPFSRLFRGAIQSLATDSKGDVVAFGYYQYNWMLVWKFSGATGQVIWAKGSENPFGGEPMLRNSSIGSGGCFFDAYDNLIVTAEVNGIPPGGPDFDLYAAKYEGAKGFRMWERRWRNDGNYRWGGTAVDHRGNIIIAGQGEGGHAQMIRYEALSIDDQYVTFPSHTEAMLHTRVRVSDPQAKIYAEYGTDGNYGLRTPEVSVSADGLASVLLGGLTAPKAYNYRLVVETSDGVIAGMAQVFDMTKAPNQAPIAQEDAYVEPAAGGLTEFIIDALANDSDPDRDPLHIFSVSQGKYGTATIDGGKVMYKPAAGFVADVFTYTVADSYGAKATAVITVRRSSEQPPVIGDDSVQANAGPVEFNALANDYDPEGKVLSVVGLKEPANGTVQFRSDGRMQYAPAANFSGQDQFTYTVSDGILRSIGTVRVTVSNPDRPPIALDDAKEVGSGKSSLWWILSNDRDPDGKTLYIKSYTQPASGTGTLAGSSWVNPTWFSGYRDLEYTPPAGFIGEVEFTYVITDGSLTAEATVKLTVNGGATPENKPPLAQGDFAYIAAYPTSTDIWCLANDTDPEGATLVISSFSQPAKGSVVSIPGGLRYIPNPGIVGEDQFTYVVSNGSLLAQATVRVFLLANLPPVAVNDVVQSNGRGGEIDVLSNDSDPEGKPLSIASFTQPLHGNVTSTAGGGLHYKPHPRFIGTDQFIYTVTDGVFSISAPVTVTVTADIRSEDPADVLYTSGSSWSSESAKFLRFGIPSVNDRGEAAFVATYSARLRNSKVVTGVFAGQPLAPFVWKNHWAPGANGLALSRGELFRSFKDPLLNDRGDVAFLATLSKASAQQDSGLWLKPADGQLRMVAREGDPAVGVDGARLGAFISLGLTDSGAIPFVAKLQVGKGGVTSANALGLWMYTEEGTQLLLRQGDTLQVGGVSKQVKLFAALTAASNSPGHGRLGAGQELLVRVTWNDKTQSMVRVSPSAAPQILVSSGDLASGTEARFASFGFPSPDEHGGFAVSATLQEGEGGVTSANDICVYACTPEGVWQLLAREAEGEILDLERSQPVRNAEGRTAFIVRNSETGTDEVWSAEDGLVYGGDEQPSSGPFRSIVSLALPNGEFGGAVYLACSERSDAKRKKAAASPMGLWAIDDAGVHHLLCEVGQRITVTGKQKTIRSIAALQAVPRSGAQPRSYNSKGQIIYRATFTDGTQAILQQRLP